MTTTTTTQPKTLAPCVSCDVPRYKPGTGGRPGARAAGARGACMVCYKKHRAAGTLHLLGPSPSDPASYVPARERTGAFGQFQMHASHLTTNTPPAVGQELEPDVDAVDPLVVLAGYVPTTALPVLDPDQMRHARLAVCGRAASPDEARVLLAELGLVHA